ncbi:sodium:solute symporter [Flavitalea sp. BT771]|uniref:sodium:solute symporter n=1 Tax=Flavitalea sp. BT771 TaxID=3063329 RepID=UPI0026E31E67|nr:sodium:solute symporter [Flavitalea sp. BT771]MDO6435082.1 sodium:solute symporter [Flavitalea sp. BT771]MDV6223982.1 sodium:solute symporter [Flavitalea sp. BT771]
MSPLLLFSFVIGYFLLLLAVAWRTSRHSNNDSFFIGNRNSNWMLVAFGMIGTSLSGVTFVSVPGTVGDFAGDMHKGFSYFQVVIGYFIGYFVVAFVLLPLYYRLHLTSIYNYLQTRFGKVAYRTGALFFIISRTVGATARLYLVINVLHFFILKDMGVPFALTTFVILLMILLYTLEGGVKTIVYTDTLQTTFMLLGLVVCIVYILRHMDFSFGSAMQTLDEKSFTSIFNFDIKSKGFFLKQVVGGMFITIAMTGLDQEMMQKNISVKNLRDSQKNMVTFSVIMVLVNFLFLLLGGLLYLFVLHNGATYQGHQLMLEGHNIIGDDLFPTLALHAMPDAVAILFIIGLISALFPSADGALTALTSSFCIDLLGLRERADLSEQQKKRMRMTVHGAFAVLFLICILIFKWIDNKSIIGVILDLAGYTYGPLLGLFAFGVFSRRHLPNNGAITVICLLAPVICFFISRYSSQWLGGFQIGIELLLLNGTLTFLGLLLISKRGVAAN